MPAGYESGLRFVEHYAGRAVATKQTRGTFPALSSAADVNPNRVIRNASNRLTGTAAQHQSTITAHGVRPTASIPMDVKTEDLLLPLMSFFHNVLYTEGTQGTGGPAAYTTPWTEQGLFQFGMLDAKPDHVGAVVGVYDDAAATYKETVAMSDAYSIGIEQLYGHGDLDDSDNAVFIENFVANKLTWSVESGIDQYLQLTVEGFGRDGSELEDVTEAAWGPGVNGSISDLPVLTPDTASFTTVELNEVDVASTFTDWFDGLTIEMMSGLAGRDALGADSFNALKTEGRPSVTGTIRMGHISAEFLTALVNAHKFELVVSFINSATDKVTITLKNLRLGEGFTPNIEGADSDVNIEVPFVGVVDPEEIYSLCEVAVETTFDVRTVSFFLSPTLAAAATYIA